MVSQLDPLIKQWDPVLRKAFEDSLYQTRNAAQIDQIARMLLRGDVDGALLAVGLDPTQFRGSDKTLTVAFEAGGVKEPAGYDRDLYSWAIEQAALLRAGRIAEADALNIAEEIDDVGNEQYDKLESALRVILLHLLKWEHQPERRSRSWWSSILVQRKHVLKVLRKNPGLQALIEEAVVEAYDDARIEAAGETGLRPQTFPKKCPYSFAEIMERPIEWPAD